MNDVGGRSAPDPSTFSPSYGRVFRTFLRNATVREMTFRGNFLIELVTRACWFAAQLTLFEVIYRNVPKIGDWSRPEYFAFMATGMLVNAIVETFFMPNCANFSEMIRSGSLDFVLVKPIDTQFLVSFEKMNLAMLNQVLLAVGLLVYSLYTIGRPVSAMQVVFYLMFVGVAVAFFYSLMITLASASIWLVRNQGLYDFWFYITVFARYPQNIYDGSDPNRLEAADVMQFGFSYIIPILLVVTVPARIIARTVDQWQWVAACLAAAVVGLVVSRFIFNWSLANYRSASS